MTGRRNFLRDIALGIAATLVPKVLRPASFEIDSEATEIVSEQPRSKIISVSVYRIHNANTENFNSFYDRKIEGKE